MSSIGRAVWQVRLARWHRPPSGPPVPGYALVVPVPGDLPVFTHLALASCVRQSALDRVETLVVPDRPDPRVTALVEQARRDWPGPLRELLIRRPERAVLPRLGNAGRNHGYQIATAVEATAATHVVLHDADLFLLEPGAHDAQFREAVDRDLDALGVSPAWDDWYAAHGRTLAATWEMVARTDWLRACAPWRLLGHEARVYGERHVLDTTFWGQVHTDPERIAVHDGTGGLVHFNYLISQYRLFLRTGAGYVDDYGCLLVIRVLSDLFLPAAAVPELPAVATLRQGLTESAGRVTYVGVAPDRYARNRALLEQVLDGPWADDALRAQARATLAPFDEHFGWQPAPSEPRTPAAPPPAADVTVVVPARNREALLGHTLRSVLAQVPAPAAVLVVDDASADDSAAVAAAHGATVVRNTEARGPGGARNTGLAAARTRWVAFCDSDDLWLPGHLAGLLRAAEGQVLVTAPARTSTGGWWGNASGRHRPLDVHALLVPGEGIVTSGTMVDRAAALAVGGFPEQPLAEDFALWLRLLDAGSGVEVPDVGVLYRRHEDQISADGDEMRAAVRGVLDSFAGRPWLTSRLRSLAGARPVWDELRIALREGDRTGVATALRWYAAHPAGVLALRPLLLRRADARRAARRMAMDLAMPAPVSGSGRPDPIDRRGDRPPAVVGRSTPTD